MNMKALLLLAGSIITYQVNAIDWQPGNWAFACDFPENSFSNIQVRGEDCGGRCVQTEGCTHFTWTTLNGGTCFMKKGNVGKENAFDTGDRSMVCGIVWACPNPGDTVSGVNGINWQPANWAFACNFPENNLSNVQIRGEDCGDRCAQTDGCSHFTWTNHNGGTCWMKRGNVGKENAIGTGDCSMVCGIVRGDPNPGSNTGSNPGSNPGPSSDSKVHYNVLATHHENKMSDGDSCALPQASYDITDALALGDKPELGNLGFKPDLCGHVVRIDCGHGALDVVITNSNIGGGLDLYSESAWPKLTANASPGETKCSVQLSARNPLSGGVFQCYYEPGTGTDNAYYRSIGLLNTGSKIVTGATLGGQLVNPAGPNPYYAFTGRAIDINEQVVFSFNDGSTHSVRFSDCKSVGSRHRWI